MLYKYTMKITLILFLIVILGFLLNMKNIILSSISIEIRLFSMLPILLVSLHVGNNTIYNVAGAPSMIIITLSLLGSIVYDFFGRRVDVSGGAQVFNTSRSLIHSPLVSTIAFSNFRFYSSNG